MTAEEMDDVAQTVTHIAMNINKPKGPAMLAVYGIPKSSRDWVLADIMEMSSRQKNYKGVSALTVSQLKNFMLLAIADVRFVEYGETIHPKTSYYDLCKLTAHEWKKFELYELRRMAQTMLQSWIDDAAKELEVELDAIDMLSE